MAIDASVIIGYVLSLVGQLVWGLVGIGSVAGLWYYLFIIRRRRFWLVDVYEQKSDGKLYLVEKDRLQEKKINYGKQTIYIFKKTKTESIPPPYECVRKLGNKEYCDYVRILGEYVPMEKKESHLPNFNAPKVKQTIFRIIKNKLKQIRNLPTTFKNADAVMNKFVYVPLSKALKYDIDYKPISYDVNMMRINEIDSLDKMFEKKKDFWQKYGSMIIIGGGIVMVIVIAYMSFEYMQQVIGQTLGAANKVAGPLEALVDKISGSPPPT